MNDNECPACNGQEEYLGTLGFLDWYRCINCGMQWSVESEFLLEEEEQNE